MIVKFVSYDGAYPNLCYGTLVISVDGDKWVFPRCCLRSEGGAGVDENYEEFQYFGPWSIKTWPKGFPEAAKDEALRLVNENVEQGCCGGCI